MSECSPNSPRATGNTIPSRRQISTAKKWVFTFHFDSGTPDVAVVPFLKTFGLTARRYGIGYEKGSGGNRPHLQGFVEFKTRLRPKSLKLLPNTTHWEKQKGSLQSNIAYVQKEGLTTWLMGLPRPIVDPLAGKVLYNWQRRLWDRLEGEPDDRTVIWRWEPDGNCGKTAFVKSFILGHPDAIYVAGDTKDIYYAIAAYMEKNEEGPRTVFFNLTRSGGTISYKAFEAIKDGMFFNAKFKSGMCIFNNPHIVVFANREPNIYNLSEDRWDIELLEHS